MASSGKLGALVVIIAIVGTILGGTALGSEEVARTSTDYTFVSDVSGLYKYSDQEIFVDYNPSANLTGFTTAGKYYTSGITYDISTGLTSYPVMQQAATTTSGTASVPSGLSNFIDKRFAAIQVKLYPDPGTSNDDFYYTVGSANYNSLSDVIKPLLTEDAEKIRINGFDYKKGEPIIIRTSDIQIIEGNVWATPKPYYPTLNPISYYEYDLTSQIVRAFGANDIVVWQTNIDSVIMVSGGNVHPFTMNPGVSSLSTYFSYTITMGNPPVYLDPTKGVELQYGSGQIKWSNGYVNDKLSIQYVGKADGIGRQDELCILTSDYGSYNSIYVIVNNNYNGNGITVGVFQSNINQEQGYQNSYGNQLFYCIFKDFYSFRMDIDTTSDKISFVPIGPPVGQSEATFQNYQEYPALSKTFDASSSDIDILKIDKMWFYATKSSSDFRFVIKDTSVFMDTYINVIYNQSFNISDYFPDVRYPRLDLKSFAMYGDSITINDQTFTGLNDGYIDVIVDGKSRSLLLDNISIMLGMPGDYRINLIFNNDGTIVDLGTLKTKVLEFGGAWYMATDLYSGESVTTTGYEFNPLQWAFADNNVAILFYLGLLALCSIVAARYSSMGWADIILVSCAGIVGFLLLV